MSKLAVKTFKYDIESLEDIPDSSYRLGTIGGTNLQTYFEGATDETSIQHHLWPLVKNNLVTDNEEAFNRLLEEDDFAVFLYESVGKATPHFPCRIITVGKGYLKVKKP